MARKAARERIRDRRRRRQLRSRLIWGGLGVALIGLVTALAWPRARPAATQAIPVMDSIAHVEVGADPGPYNSDPPTSGRHYERSLPAGFYSKDDAAEFEPYPAGFLVHSLEHGYVIFWYNCDRLSESDCAQLQEQIRQVMRDADDFKVIAFPWASIEQPVVMTSWGQLLRMQSFDPAAARQFIRSNLNKAPEPHAP